MESKESGVYLILGNDSMLRGHFNKAIEYYQQAIGIKPDFISAYCNMAEAYRKIRKFDKALECYFTAMEIDPSDTELTYNIGITYTEKGDLKKSIKYFKKAIEKYGKNIFRR